MRVARSTDGGRTWRSPITPHRDGTPTEHGFVSLVPLAGGGLGAVWLDGRKFAKGGEVKSPTPIRPTGTPHDHGSVATNEMTLRYATLGADGSLAGEVELDARVCDCCQTAAAVTSEGVIVVHRDRSDDEVRDFSVVRLTGDGWSAPRPLHHDNWRISACPVNGAAIAARGRRVAVAWYTAADERPRVLTAFSEDAGLTFGRPVEVAAGAGAAAEGRVDVVLLGDDEALVSWLGRLAGTKTEAAAVRARRVRADGTQDEAFDVAPTQAKRASGFPRAARGERGVLFAWTAADEGEHTRVRTAEVTAPPSPIEH